MNVPSLPTLAAVALALLFTETFAPTTVVAQSAVTLAHAAEAARPLTTLDRVDAPAEWIGLDDSGRLKFRLVPTPPAAADGKPPADAEAATIEIAVAPADLVAWGSPPDASGGTNVLLIDGTTFAVDTVATDSESLHAKLLGTERSIPLTQVRGVVFRSIGTTSRRERLFHSVAATRKGDRDRLITLTGDETAGTVKSIDQEGVTIETSLGPAVVELEKLSHVIFNPALAAAAPQEKLRMLVGLRSGSLVVSEPIRRSASGRIELRPTAVVGGAAWEVQPTEITFLQTLGGRSTPLSSLEPTGYRHIPYLGGTWPYHADRSASGAALRVAGRRHLTGVGMHSTSRLSFPLDGRATRFAASLAIDDETDGRGSVVFRVFVDGAEKYRSPTIRGGDRPTPIEVSIAGGKQLSLVVDFADFADEQDHADWLEARLLP